jgi:hypothetical protein
MSKTAEEIGASDVQHPNPGPTNGPEPEADVPSAMQAPAWTTLMAPPEWEVYETVLRAMRRTGIPFVLGGAFGLAAYTQRWRNTKDLDFFILPRDRERGIELLAALGLTDYYDTLPYDRGWIYRAARSGVLVDLIWSTPNRRTEVEESWFEHCQELRLRTETVKIIPAEELLWIKLYVVQRDRCDWPDLINLLYATSAVLDWNRLVARLGEDLPLLLGLLSVFAWVCPDRVRNVPAKLRRAAGLPKQPPTATSPDQMHIQLLDSRPWFAAQQPCDAPMQL